MILKIKMQKAKIQSKNQKWIPAFAGMTENGVQCTPYA